jgi:hypothetical protein
MGNADGPTFVAHGGNFSYVSCLCVLGGSATQWNRSLATTHPLAAAMEFGRPVETKLKNQPNPKIQPSSASTERTECAQ